MAGHYIPLETRGVLQITGDDAHIFLQGLITNNIEWVTSKRSIYACLLTPQGKYLYDFFISAVSGGFLLDIHRASRGAMLQTLKRYKLRSKVELQDVSDSYRVVAFPEKDAIAALGLQQDAGNASFTGGGVFYVDPRYAPLGVRAILSHDTNIPDGFLLGELSGYEALRVKCGVPDGVKDMVSEKDFPMQFGFDALHAIDFNKGCYVGQEVTARTKHRGGIRKMPVKVTASQSLPECGSTLTIEDKIIGTLLSSSGNLGIAQIQKEAWEKYPEHKASCSGIDVELKLPDWLTNV